MGRNRDCLVISLKPEAVMTAVFLLFCSWSDVTAQQRLNTGDPYYSPPSTARDVVFGSASWKHLGTPSETLGVWRASCSAGLGCHSASFCQSFLVFVVLRIFFARIRFHPLYRCLKIIWCWKLLHQLPARLWGEEAALSRANQCLNRWRQQTGHSFRAYVLTVAGRNLFQPEIPPLSAADRWLAGPEKRTSKQSHTCGRVGDGHKSTHKRCSFKPQTAVTMAKGRRYLAL